MSHKTKTFMGKDQVFSVTQTGSMNSLRQWWWCWGVAVDKAAVAVVMMRIIIITTIINIFYTF